MKSTSPFGVGAARLLLVLLGLASRVPCGCLAENGIKAAPSGLVSFGFPPDGWQGIFNCIVQKVKWEELEPAPGEYDAGFRKIDEMLERTSSQGLFVHLLIVCGADSPAWLKEVVGTVTVYDTAGVAYNPQSKGGRTCARWWNPAFGAAYSRMQAALAARYDAHPRLAAVGMTQCMSYWPEPFMRQLREEQNRKNLCEAGYSSELDKVAQSETLVTHARCWKRTCSSIALNPYQEMLTPDSWAPNMEYTAAFIGEAVEILGGRLILQNDSFVYDRSRLGEEYWKMYELMGRSGAIFGLQPRGTTAETIGDVRKLIEAAILQRASYLELVNIYKGSAVSKEEFAEFDRLLEANAR